MSRPEPEPQPQPQRFSEMFMKLKAWSPPPVVERPKPAAGCTLNALKFMGTLDGDSGWPSVEQRFDEGSVLDGRLPRSLFGCCIGATTTDGEFASELFDALAWRRNISGDSISKAELRDFWDRMSDANSDSRLQIFFDMADKTADGRITEDEVKEIIVLSASMYKLPKIREKADEYASLIMDELDPSNLGYTDLESFEKLLLHAPDQPTSWRRRHGLRPAPNTGAGGEPPKPPPLQPDYYHDGSSSNSALHNAKRAFVNCLRKVLLIDGPYGSTAQRYKQYDTVLLISLGTGAAPMISIVKDILNNTKQCAGGGDDLDLECAAGTKPSSSSSLFRTRRAYFYWLAQEPACFEWFRGAMDEVAETDMKCAIELNNYCTSIRDHEDGGDARSAVVAAVQSHMHAKAGFDVVSGSRVETHFGTPDWRSVYKRVARAHRNQRVGVFYCGAHVVLKKELRELAQDLSTKTTTKFEFHKQTN